MPTILSDAAVASADSEGNPTTQPMDRRNVTTPSPPGDTSTPLPTAKRVVDKPFFIDLKAGDTDPLTGVKIKEVLVKTDEFIVYIDQDLSLHWHWNTAADPNAVAPIFNRAGELQAKSEFLRQAFRKRNLVNARRLIGEGLTFCTKNPADANGALDTAQKFITQRGRETSRGWYFGPFFVFFAVSVVIGLMLYAGQAQVTTLPLICALGGGVGAFISTAIGNERIPCAPSAGWILHFLEALLRYTIGLAAGLLVWLATAGNLAIGFLNFVSNPPSTAVKPGELPVSAYALIAVAILAGTSERLLPSLIARFDDSIKGTTATGTTETETPKPAPAGKSS